VCALGGRITYMTDGAWLSRKLDRPNGPSNHGQNGGTSSCGLSGEVCCPTAELAPAASSVPYLDHDEDPTLQDHNTNNC
jgi:hypothetical protein